MSGAGHACVGSPSALARTVQCPGWVQLAAGLPEQPETDEIKEGHAAEWVAYEMDVGRKPVVGKPAPNGVLVTSEMIQGGMLWAHTTRCTGGVTQIPISCSPIHPLSWGTPDKQYVTDAMVINWDFKNGHLLHDPFEHWQSLGYLAGACEMHGLLNRPDVMCEVVIVQPRDYSNTVKRWRLSVGELRAYINIAAAAVEQSLQPNAPTRVGKECLMCPARLKCGTLQQTTSRLIEFAGAQSPVEMTTDALGCELTLLREARKMLEARETAIVEQIKALWFAGKKTRGYSCEQGVSRLNWNRDAGEVIATGQAFQIDLRKSPHPALITPTQAKERGLPENVVKLLASRQPGEWQVVRDDPRKIAKRFEQ